MATITKYETAKGPRYRVRYRKPDRSQTDKRGFTTKRDAQDFLHTIEASKLRGDYIDPAASAITVAELQPAWLASKQTLKPSSIESIKTAWRVHVEPVWGSTPLSQIRHSDVAAWIGAFTSSASVQIRAFGVLAGILDLAVHDRRIRTNPARGIKLRRKPKPNHVYLTYDQVERIVAHARKDRRTLLRVLAYTGLRWGEAIALRVRDVSEVPRRLHITENAVQVRGKIHVGTPKSHEQRAVPYAEFLQRELHDLTRNKPADALLFNTTYLLSPDSTDGWFASALKRAQADDGTIRRVRIHDLRHTAASLAISAGANVKVVQRMLGHASAALTLDTYADLITDDLDTVAERIHTARVAASVGKMWAN